MEVVNCDTEYDDRHRDIRNEGTQLCPGAEESVGGGTNVAGARATPSGASSFGG